MKMENFLFLWDVETDIEAGERGEEGGWNSAAHPFLLRSYFFAGCRGSAGKEEEEEKTFCIIALLRSTLSPIRPPVPRWGQNEKKRGVLNSGAGEREDRTRKCCESDCRVCLEKEGGNLVEHVKESERQY